MDIRPVYDAQLLARLNRPLQDLHVQHYPGIYKPYDEAAITHYFLTCLADDSYLHWAAYKGETPIGYLQAQIIQKPENAFGYAQHSLHVHQLMVDAAHRRSGAATLLMQTVKEAAQQHGIHRIDLTVRDFNEAAIAFYKSLGYKTDMLRVWMEV